MVMEPATGRLRHVVARFALLAAVSALALAAGVAHGANAPAPALPAGSQTVSVPHSTGPATPSRGMAVSGTGSHMQAHVVLPGTAAVAQGCPHGNRMEVRLGMLKNSAAFAHCDYP